MSPKIWHAGCLLVLLAGCASEVMPPAGSVVNESASSAKPRDGKEWRPEVYVVQKGDTLYGIAFNYGYGYRELAEMNGIQNPDAIFVGQKIRLLPAKVSTVNTPAAPVVPQAANAVPKEQPKLVKYSYSEAAMALIDKVQQGEGLTSAPSVVAPPKPAAKESGTKTEKNVEVAGSDSEEPALEWHMPTQGKLIGQFSETANRKGIDIAGKLGQPVYASAAGKVVYSGSGLRGYGKLIIVKHNATYLSAYAHNDKILVKEGQSVTRGQKIAAMGSTDADQVKLHFEIRRLGKPVDPQKFLTSD
jgi:lipoprotein NlpD